MPDNAGFNRSLRYFYAKFEVVVAFLKLVGMDARCATVHQYPNIVQLNKTHLANLRVFKVDHTDPLRRCIPHDMSRCKKPATAREIPRDDVAVYGRVILDAC